MSMVTELEKVMGILKLLLVFITLTAMFYGVILWVEDQVERNFQNEPRGRAVKVQQTYDTQEVDVLTQAKQRLYLFYQMGE